MFYSVKCYLYVIGFFVLFASFSLYKIYIIDVDETTFTKKVFEGLTFSELSKHLMEQNGTLLLAVGTTDPSAESPMGRPSQVILNPANMVLYREPKLERLFAMGRSKETVCKHV